MKAVFMLLLFLPLAALGANPQCTLTSKGQLPQSTLNCGCAATGVCSCGADCNCGDSCTCIVCGAKLSYAQARAKAVKTHSNIVVWVGSNSNETVKALSKGWVHCIVDEYQGSSEPRAVVGRYEGGEMWGCENVTDKTPSAIEAAAQRIETPSSYYSPPVTRPVQYYIQPSFLQPSRSFVPSFGGGGGRRGGGGC